MKTIAYTGTSDFQEFSKDDFAKAGVEVDKDYRFARNEPTEVEDEVANVLTNRNDSIFDDFLFEDVTEAGEDAETEQEALFEQEKLAEKASKKAAKKAASSSDAGGAPTEGDQVTTQGTGDSATPTSTGSGTSTGGSTTGSTT